MREKIEALEHHTNGLALSRRILRAQGLRSGCSLTHADALAIDMDDPGLNLLQCVNAAQESAFAGAARPDERN